MVDRFKNAALFIKIKKENNALLHCINLTKVFLYSYALLFYSILRLVAIIARLSQVISFPQ